VTVQLVFSFCVFYKDCGFSIIIICQFLQGKNKVDLLTLLLWNLRLCHGLIPWWSLSMAILMGFVFIKMWQTNNILRFINQTRTLQHNDNYLRSIASLDILKHLKWYDIAIICQYHLTLQIVHRLYFLKCTHYDCDVILKCIKMIIDSKNEFQ
jgi:hypothetical protein